MGAILALIYMVAEVVISLEIADQIGTLATVLWLVFAVILGIGIIRVQGPLRMMQAAQAMREGKRPELSIAAGFFGALAGVLILLPGFLSDFLGLMLLIPLVQRWLVARLKSKVKVAGMATHAHFTAGFGHKDAHGNVYEGEVESSPQAGHEKRLDRPSGTDEAPKL